MQKELYLHISGVCASQTRSAVEGSKESVEGSKESVERSKKYFRAPSSEDAAVTDGANLKGFRHRDGRKRRLRRN